MISFKQFLAEAFDSSYPYKVTSQGDSDVIRFEDDKGRLYIANYTTFGGAVLDLSFSTQLPNGIYTIRVTSDGANAIKVYSTIGVHLKKFLKKHPRIYKIRFESADPRTAKVYSLLARRISKDIKNSVYGFDGQRFYIDL